MATKAGIIDPTKSSYVPGPGQYNINTKNRLTSAKYSMRIKPNLRIKEETDHSTIPVTEDGSPKGKFLGIITSKDYRLSRDIRCFFREYNGLYSRISRRGRCGGRGHRDISSRHRWRGCPEMPPVPLGYDRRGPPWPGRCDGCSGSGTWRRRGRWRWLSG